MSADSLKALYIVVDTGFAEKVVEYIRSAGAGGATILNARGISHLHKEIMGISVDKEKEMVVTVTDSATADRIMRAVKQDMGFATEAHGICYALPVDRAVGLSHPAAPHLEKEQNDD